MRMLLVFGLLAILLTSAGIVHSEEALFLTPAGKRLDHPEVPRISALETRKLFLKGKLILANAHESGNFEKKHILGSIPIPNDQVGKVDFDIPNDVIVAFYCE